MNDQIRTFDIRIFIPYDIATTEFIDALKRRVVQEIKLIGDQLIAEELRYNPQSIVVQIKYNQQIQLYPVR
jgi:hypothetical protein